jgi:hypothetical protein
MVGIGKLTVSSMRSIDFAAMRSIACSAIALVVYKYSYFFIFSEPLQESDSLKTACSFFDFTVKMLLGINIV